MAIQERSPSRRRLFDGPLLLAICLAASGMNAGEFLRPTRPGDPPIYGIKDGIAVTVHPHSLDWKQNGGPRGLLRVGYQDGEQFHLVNFIAIEPIVRGARGYSELERGATDGRQGRPFFLTNSIDERPVEPRSEAAAYPPGKIEDTPEGRVLTLAVHNERFKNGSRPIIEMSFFERTPDRVRFRTFAADDSQPMDACILTATMGNQSRCRRLWLANKAVSSLDLYSAYDGFGFVEHRPYGVGQLHRTSAGDVVAAISPDEFEPREVFPFPESIFGERFGRAWHHSGRWMAQFWLKPAGTFDDSLQCRVNGRRVYWMSRAPIPGGVSYENFELRERFAPGRESWFGFTTQSPRKKFGFTYDAAPEMELCEIPEDEGDRLDEVVKDGRPLTGGLFADGLVGWHLEGRPDGVRLIEKGKHTLATTEGGPDGTGPRRIYQSFVVPPEANDLRFYMAGGCDPKRLYVALWDGDRLWRRMTGGNGRAPFEVRWDLKPLRGRAVTLEIVDRKDGPWGFIEAGGFEVRVGVGDSGVDKPPLTR
ncbi:MAG TPA: hypothetical protein DD670_20350 [Planctomycetaceae bacterium]|nr:hypothetical protein [Planctomycetaceae bacterium]